MDNRPRKIVSFDRAHRKLVVAKENPNAFVIEIRGNDVSGNYAIVSTEVDADFIRQIARMV